MQFINDEAEVSGEDSGDEEFDDTPTDEDKKFICGDTVEENVGACEQSNVNTGASSELDDMRMS